MPCPDPSRGRGRMRTPAPVCCTLAGLVAPGGQRGPWLDWELGEGAGRCTRHNQGAISANQPVLEIDPTGWGKRGSSRPGLYSGNQGGNFRFAATALCPGAGTLLRVLRSPLRLGDKHTPRGRQLPPPRKRGAQAVGPAAARVKSKFFSTLAGHLPCAGCTTAISFVRGGLHFAGEGIEAPRDGGFAPGHWSGQWLS